MIITPDNALTVKPYEEMDGNGYFIGIRISMGESYEDIIYFWQSDDALDIPEMKRLRDEELAKHKTVI